MIFAALQEAAECGELILIDGGLCRYHLCRDGSVTIREILVLPALRRRRKAMQMLAEVKQRHPESKIRARCPVQYEANAFWLRVGFVLRQTVDGINLWELP